jgi:penicillin amidase
VNRRWRIILGILGSLAILLVALVLFMRFQIRKSFPQTEGVISLPELSSPVEIYRDPYGVPSIEARNDHDLLVAYGYVQAQDRLWQMDMERRIGMGRLSEIVGEATLPFDRMFRIVGIRRAAEEVERKLPAHERERLQWFADGVNAFIRGSQGRYPVEFDFLRYDPEPWEPLHSLIVGKLLAWELNLSWWTDLTYGAMVEKVGLERAMEIYPGYPSDVAPEVPEAVRKGYAALRESYLATARLYAEATGRVSASGGSNAWAVAPAKSARGSVILANDTHLQLQSPSQWHEAELRTPDLHVRGMAIVGVPAIVAGRNDRIAWGITNVMADDADFYVERIDSTDSTKVQYGGASVPMTILQEEIRVRGEEPVPLAIRLTRHGPVVTDVRTDLQKVHAPYVASMRWTGADPDDQLAAFDGIDRAGSWDQFTAALRLYPGPGQNFVYGDVDGNIGYWCAAKLPIRSTKTTILPQPGWDPGAEWKGFIPFEQLPHLYNPPEGFIASANNRLVDDAYPYHISDLWEPPSRIRRLRELLGAGKGGFTAGDFERMESDRFSDNAQEVLPLVMAAFKDSALGLPEEERVFEYLRNWNFTFAPEDIATTIYQSFYVRLLHNTYADELGDDLFHDWVMLANVPIRVTTRLLREGTSRWFDDVRTGAVETRDDIIRKSLREAVVSLEDQFGLDMKLWRWGDIHTVTFRHFFGLRKPLDRIFNIGPFPCGGASTALCSGEYSFNDPYRVTVGPSFRQIFDLGDGEMRSVLPGGESGQVFHPHYADQTELWLHGANRVNRWGVQPLQGQRLRLVP